MQVVKLAKEAGLVSLGRVAVDSTKIKANASKHKAMSYGRMQELVDDQPSIPEFAIVRWTMFLPVVGQAECGGKVAEARIPPEG